MQCLLLVTEPMKPVPENIKTVQDWGEVWVRRDDDGSLTLGDHMWLQGEESDFVDWLRPFERVWITAPGTSPMAQQFILVHIGEA